MAIDEKKTTVRVLCPKLVLSKNESDLQWLIGSPFLPPRTIVSTFRCIHTLPSKHDSVSPDFVKESEALRCFLLRGLHVIGALVTDNFDLELNAGKAIDASRRLKKILSDDDCVGKSEETEVIGAVADSNSGDIQIFVSRSETVSLERVSHVEYENHPEKFFWETGCLLKCGLSIKLPVNYPIKNPADVDKNYILAMEAVIAKLNKTQAVYMIEGSRKTSAETPRPVIVRGSELDFQKHLLDVNRFDGDAQTTDAKLPCSHFCVKSKSVPPVYSAENADLIQITALFNTSEKLLKAVVPVAEYFPALEETRLLVVDLKLDVLCYTSKDLLLSYSVSKLIIPGLIDQLRTMKNTILPVLLTHQPQLRPYHFSPPGVLHPITVIYEANYGETEMKQVETRRSLHLRLGLPCDRPLLRIANSLDLSSTKDTALSKLRKASPLLKDVHVGIPNSGVSGGVVSLVQGSYDYHHYLQNDFDDSGWGCAYRSLQTIISWFRLQQYTFIDVPSHPSHREIQQSLVEIGDKETFFIGSREWIGAIELSFVLDKLLGVSSKVMNFRSGAEVPERCRELALHFENQGTPIMIGGGVLAYTLLGVDYNEASGDCAFLILDPHYTGNDELKKVVNGGWCGWKKAVDSKGRNFFLHDKFYNLLLPQRPNMV